MRFGDRGSTPLASTSFKKTHLPGGGISTESSFRLSACRSSVSTEPVHQRLLTAEILDTMNPSDPRAIRSRWDLKWINAFLGNERRILRELRRQGQTIASIVELGAGEGLLCENLCRNFRGATVTGLDLAPRPSPLPESIDWVRGNFLETLNDISGESCVGSLILHHFSNADLGRLGMLLARFRTLVFCEPLRRRLPMFLSRIALPFAGEVTRHDMPASIRAGFRKGELPLLLGLDLSRWEIRESESARGTITLSASRG
jgi:hypothetical protein